MKRLLILRHAKASWDDPSLSDFDRPLNGQGLTAAPLTGKTMADRGLVPDLILSSPAKRAATTAELVRGSAGISAPLRFDERIYEASPLTLRNVISEIGDGLGSALLVGHNPGMEGFIRYLTGGVHPMPTAALAVVDLRIDSWREVEPECGHLVELIRPPEQMS